MPCGAHFFCYDGWRMGGGSVGGFFSRTDTKLNAYDPYLDKSGTIDFESDLDLKEFTVLPYVEVEYYFNKKHSVYVDWRGL